MKLWAIFTVALILGGAMVVRADPRNRRPDTPDKVYQNDKDLLDQINHLGLRIIRMSTASLSSDLSTTATSWTSTGLSGTIFVSTGNRVLVMTSGSLSTSVSNENARLTIARGSTNLGGTLGFTALGNGSTGTITSPYAMIFPDMHLDAPLLSGATTYNVQIESTNGGSVTFSCSNRPCWMILAEINGL